MIILENGNLFQIYRDGDDGCCILQLLYLLLQEESQQSWAKAIKLGSDENVLTK